MASPIVELRQYTLHPHRRDDLIDMFDAHFVEPQEAAGMAIIGQFRNLDDPNKFVWLRGFPSMEVRARGLAEFYGGPEWKSRRNAANETIIDNDNVLLLRPVHPTSAFALNDEPRAPTSARQPGHGIVVATIYHIDPTDAKERDFIDFFEQTMTPLLVAAGAPVIATFVPERSANNFPGLPIREGEHVFVWFSRFPSAAAFEHFQHTLGDMPRWRDSVAVELSSKVREPQTLRLSPTARSRLHG
ncbi:MAG TPA: NIPSNAP family protein [Gemmatimonadaceae bacterium]